MYRLIRSLQIALVITLVAVLLIPQVQSAAAADSVSAPEYIVVDEDVSLIPHNTASTVKRSQILWSNTYTGSASSSYREYWPIQFTELRNFRLLVRTTSGDLVTRVTLRGGGFDGTSTIVSQAGTGTLAVLDHMQGAGNYNVMVEALSGSGSYSIIAYRIDTYERDSMAWDQVFSGNVSSTRAEKWRFWFSATRTFYLTATTTSGDLRARIRLLNSGGGEIARVDGTTNTTVLNSTQASGWYYAIVEPVGATSGSYSFVIRQGTPPSPPPPAPSLRVTHIEVSQAIQDEWNQLPLVANKPTFIRVYVDCGSQCSSVNVEGDLQLSYLGTGGTPQTYQPINEPIKAFDEDKWQNHRGDLNKTLNFSIPASAVKSGNMYSYVTIRGNGKTATYGLTVTPVNVNPVRVVYVPIKYFGRTPNAYLMQYADWFAKSVYPSNSLTYFKGGTVTWNRSVSNLACQSTSGRDALFRELTSKIGLSGHNAHFIFGWLPQSSVCFDGGGAADPIWDAGAGRAAIADIAGAFDYSTQRVFAHELAHLLNARHPVATHWCFPDMGTKTAAYGIDPFTQTIKSDTLWDYMGKCGDLTKNQVWTSQNAYLAIYNDYFKLGSTGFKRVSPSTPIFAALEATSEWIYVSGYIQSDQTVVFDPMWKVDTDMSTFNPPNGSDYCIEAQTAQGSPIVSYCFEASTSDGETGEPAATINFAAALPYSPDIARLVIRDETAAIIGSLSASNQAPTVQITSPNGGESWSATDTPTITWTGSDPDGDMLTYRVFYSSDGITWTQLDISTQESSLTINASEISGSESAWIKVLVSDGFHTAQDSSDGSISVSSKPPQTVIASDAEILIAPNMPLWLQGSSYDTEDGFLDGGDLQWSSDFNGALGTGEEMLLVLPQGIHEVTLEATDSNGNVTTDTVMVSVQPCFDLALVTPAEGGLINIVDPPNCSDGTLRYHAGTEVQISALPEMGWALDSWSGHVDGSSQTTTITIAGDSVISASFKTGLFADQPTAGKEWMQPWIETFYELGITTGCGTAPLRYCSESPVTRGAMAVFLLRAMNYPNLPYTPTLGSNVFADMPVNGKEWMEPWVSEFYNLGITGGCGQNPLLYCPENAVTRAAMAVFILRALEGPSYIPPAASHFFSDMPVVGKEWMEPWVDELYRRGITTGCAVGPARYCPENAVTRGAMAVFIMRAFDDLPNP